MKKLCLIALLLLALVFTAVACGLKPSGEENTTTAAEAPETIGTVTGGNSQNNSSGGTTDSGETTPNPADVKIVSKSYEVFMVNGKNFFDVSALADTWLAEKDHTVTTPEEAPCESVALRGWIGFNLPVIKFGYAIDGGETVYADEFKESAEDVLFQIAGEHTARFVITADTTGLEAGEHKVVFYALVEGGAEVAFYDRLTLVITTPAPGVE